MNLQRCPRRWDTAEVAPRLQLARGGPASYSSGLGELQSVYSPPRPRDPQMMLGPGSSFQIAVGLEGDNNIALVKRSITVPVAVRPLRRLHF